MPLPRALQQAIEELLSNESHSKIQHARDELTSRYRQRHTTQYMTSDAHLLSYCATRMPATYAACREVFLNLAQHCTLTPNSLLDLGCGPGTVFWATQSVFQSVHQATLIENDAALLEYAQKFIKSDNRFLDVEIHYRHENITTMQTPDPHDLVVLSYVLNELNAQSITKVLQTAWNQTRQTLVLIEPGTPFGFQRIKNAREQLIHLGAHCIAPCPHNNTCPITGDDWCHFSTRLDRSTTHQQAKQASLGYEDEKYSYAIFSRTPLDEPYKRILKKPLIRSGHIVFDLCAEKGYERKTFSRKEKSFYKEFKKKKWGDYLPIDE